MDSQVKGYLDAWGDRLVQLAATDPKAYVETRYETDMWWMRFFAEHHDQIARLENQIELLIAQNAIQMLRAMVDSDSAVLDLALDDDMVPLPAQRLAPDVKTVGEFLDKIEPWLTDSAMTLLMKHEAPHDEM